MKVLGYANIPLKDIYFNPKYQPRRAKTHIDELKKNIEKVGILEDVVLRYYPIEGKKWYPLSGNTRIAAAIALGMETIPAKLVECTDEEAWLCGVISNVLRYPMENIAKGEAVERIIKQRQKLEPNKKEQEIIRDLAKEYGLPYGSLVMWWISYKNVKRKLKREESEFKLKDSEKTFPSKLYNVAKISMHTDLSLADLQKIISHYGLPQRGLAKLTKKVRQLYYQGFFRNMTRTEIIEWIEDEIREMRRHGIQCTFWANRERIQEINKYCRRTNRDRDEFLDYLVGLGWRQYIRNNLREFQPGDNSDN